MVLSCISTEIFKLFCSLSILLPLYLSAAEVFGEQSNRMNSWRSDPVLIKEPLFEFIHYWNEEELDASHVRFQIEDFKTSIPSNLPPNEQRRFERKLEMKLQRQQILFLANSKDSFNEPLRRHSSMPCLSSLRNTFAIKRVSFISKEEIALSNERRRAARCSQPDWLYSPKPILVRKPRCASLPLCHMDYDSFNAWRRGSQISDELYRTNLSKSASSLSKEKLKETEDIWLKTYGFFKSFFFHCRSKNRTKPQEVIYS
ncbi:unnamed protein product [Auanema sp. JU1783]|nr:unnamed protein product [Auanema sp. JU1783]